MESKQGIEQKITPFYSDDHDRLDNLFKEFQKWKRESYPRARENFVAFKFGLQRHIVWEEEILFPVFEKHTGMKDYGPTAVMRQEHRIIGQKLEAIHKKVQQSDPNSDVEEAELLSVLKEHNDKEEAILYPALDEMASDPAELSRIFAEMNSLPEEKYRRCCDHS